MDNFILYEKIRKYTDEELEEFMKKFYWLAVLDGYNESTPSYKGNWISTTKALEK